MWYYRKWKQKKLSGVPIEEGDCGQGSRIVEGDRQNNMLEPQNY